MQRRIVGFAIDDVGDWAALLDCHHRQHIRHQPPFRLAAWIEDDDERARRVGTPWPCPLCDRCELPGRPRGRAHDGDLGRAHDAPCAARRAPRGTRDVGPTPGGARARSASWPRPIPVTDVVVVAPGEQAIPPDVRHHVEPRPGTRLAIEFLGPETGPRPPRHVTEPARGGNTAETPRTYGPGGHRMPLAVKDRKRRYGSRQRGMGARISGTRALHDTWAGVVLRRHGPEPQRAQHADDELLLPAHRAHHLGRGRVQPVLFGQRIGHRQPRLGLPRRPRHHR